MTEQQLSLITRAKDLLSRIQRTDMPGHDDFYHYQNILKERQEAAELLEQLVLKDETKTRQFVSLKARFYKIVGAAIAAKVGSEWVGNYPNLSFEQRQAVREFITELRSAISWAAAQAKRVEGEKSK